MANNSCCLNKCSNFSVGEEYIKSLIANPELVDRLACLNDGGVCFRLLNKSL